MRVVIAEDAVLLREGLARLLIDGGLEVAATVEDAIGLVTAVERDVPTSASSTFACRRPTRTKASARPSRSAALARNGRTRASQYVEERYATELLSGDTRGVGYLLKDRVADVREFLDALRRVADGGTALDPEVVAQLLARSRRPRDQLTPRESEVLALMAEGRSNAGIAERLVITEGAVEKHVSSIFTKLELAPAGSDHRRVLAVLAYLDGR